MDNKELRTVKLSSEVVERAIQIELKKLLGIDIECKASADSWDYWSVVFINVRLNVEQLKVLGLIQSWYKYSNNLMMVMCELTNYLQIRQERENG